MWRAAPVKYVKMNTPASRTLSKWFCWPDFSRVSVFLSDSATVLPWHEFMQPYATICNQAFRLLPATSRIKLICYTMLHINFWWMFWTLRFRLVVHFCNYSVLDNNCLAIKPHPIKSPPSTSVERLFFPLNIGCSIAVYSRPPWFPSPKRQHHLAAGAKLWIVAVKAWEHTVSSPKFQIFIHL